MTDVGGGLSGLLTHDDRIGVDEAEGVDHDFALYGLYRIDDNGDGARVKLFEGLFGASFKNQTRVIWDVANAYLLGVDIDARQPASETRMGVVPSDDHLWSMKNVSYTSIKV